MRHIDILIETTETLHSAIQSKDKEKGFEAVTILLMQIVEFFGFVEGTFEIMLPFLENLKDGIERGDFDEAERGTFTLLSKFRALRQSTCRRRTKSARLNN